MVTNLRFTDYFHDDEIRSEIYSVEFIEQAEEFGRLGSVEGDQSEVESQSSIDCVVEGSILGYLIKTRGEKKVWEYLKTLNYLRVYDDDLTDPEFERDFPTGPMPWETLLDFPEVLRAIDELPVREAIVQLKILSQSAWGGWLPIGGGCRSRRRSRPLNLKDPFTYTKRELKLNRSNREVYFRLPESPEELLLLGAQEGSYVSVFAYQDELPSQVVLMFRPTRQNYFGYIELDRETLGILSVSFSEHSKPAHEDWVGEEGITIAEWAHASGLPGLAFRHRSFEHDKARVVYEDDLASKTLRCCKPGNSFCQGIPDDLYYE